MGVPEIPSLENYASTLTILARKNPETNVFQRATVLLESLADLLRKHELADPVTAILEKGQLSVIFKNNPIIPSHHDVWVTIKKKVVVNDNAAIAKYLINTKHLHFIGSLMIQPDPKSKNQSKLLATAPENVTRLLGSLGVPLLSTATNVKLVGEGEQSQVISVLIFKEVLKYIQSYLWSRHNALYHTLVGAGIKDAISAMRFKTWNSITVIYSVYNKLTESTPVDCHFECSLKYEESDVHSAFLLGHLEQLRNTNLVFHTTQGALASPDSLPVFLHEFVRLFFNGHYNEDAETFLLVSMRLSYMSTVDQQQILNSQKITELPESEEKWELNTDYNIPDSEMPWARDDDNDKETNENMFKIDKTGDEVEREGLSKRKRNNSDDETDEEVIIIDSPDELGPKRKVSKKDSKQDELVTLDIKQPPIGNNSRQKRTEFGFPTPDLNAVIILDQFIPFPIEYREKINWDDFGIVDVGYAGEMVAYFYLKNKYKDQPHIIVKWINGVTETGAQHDIEIIDNSTGRKKIEYVEVKSTRYFNPSFTLSKREFFFAWTNPGFSVLRVMNLNKNSITRFFVQKSTKVKQTEQIQISYIPSFLDNWTSGSVEAKFEGGSNFKREIIA
ncbi:hypothetical protein HK096_008872 [Nowakowskiella sp. JEL0078]|nr:hypothetical protein HK096_008872 [Nowakowskiella sp. JEL0078]